jgi:hypothetical protein
MTRTKLKETTMKPANMLPLLAAGIGIAMLVPPSSGAQQLPFNLPLPNKLQQAENLVRGIRAGIPRRDPRADRAAMTFQMIEFTFGTGGDDLRSDSVVTARLAFPDASRQDCRLHGPGAIGAAANISWDNHSTHTAPPCRLDKPRTLAELKQARVVIGLYGPGRGPSIAGVMAAGPLGLAGVRSQDNWNINRVDVRAYSPGTNGQVCVFSVSADPVARLTGDQPDVTVSDFPNQCR